jgi:hypothetical protein
MKTWFGRDSVIQLNNGESWTLFMLLFDFGCQMMSSVLPMLKGKKYKKLMFTLYILQSQEHYINYTNCVNCTVFLVHCTYFETKSFTIKDEHILWEYEIM